MFFRSLVMHGKDELEITLCPNLSFRNSNDILWSQWAYFLPFMQFSLDSVN